MRTLVAIALVASVIPGVVAPGVAAAAGPSVGLPDIKPVPVSQQTQSTRPVDPATSNAVSGPQQPRTEAPGSGENTATSLSPSATWEVATQAGDYTWSYPLRVPPSPGGLEPELALSYRSSSVDGRTSVTNNQPSWVGDGWDLSVGFVERTYGGCISDSDGGTVPPKVGDLCWRSDNATAAYADTSGMLIRNQANGEWRVKNDDGARIQRLTGIGNGDNDGESWKITTVDGTQYFFGSQADSNSTWTVPVFGDDVGEPCHATTFEASHCVQAYRWNLDKVVDAHGNMIRYFYETETNKYAMNVKDDKVVTYVRGGSLRRIDYGLNEKVAGPATGQVEFTTANRCVPGAVCNFDTKASWPDTPLDSRCDAATCKDKYWPTFWTTKRLDSVTTRVRNGTGYRDVDRWTLSQLYPDPGDGEKPALWLKSLTHTGLAGTPITLPPITFEGKQLPNRVYQLSDGYAPLNRYRLTGIISESGGVTSINYEPAECSPTNLPTAAEHNTKKCFPVRWAPPGHAERTDYFHKYVVQKVIQSDQLSSSTQQVTSYEYLDGAAWHWDTSEFGKEDKKTWSEFRGFGRVRVRGGSADDPAGPLTMTEERFYRGMHGDKLPNNGTRAVTVSDSDSGVRADEDWLQGFSYESITYSGEAPSTAPAPAVVKKMISEPVWQGPTATRGAFKSYLVRPGSERGFTALASGGWRKTKTTTTYDDRGLPTTVDDRSDLATADDDQCTRTTYVRNTEKWLLNLPSQQETVSVNCDTTPRFPDHAVSGERSSYDGKAPGDAPETGRLTKTEVADSRPATGAVYATTATASYDAYGRVTQYNDALGNPAKVSFSPQTGAPNTTTVTSAPTPNVPGGLVTTTTADPAFGQPTMVVDPNGRVTEHAYDALGRKIETWLPNRWREEESASFRYSYTIRKDGPTLVTTSKLGPNGIYTNANTIYDGLMRQRQVQQPAPGGGRLITDTRYDSQGRAFKQTQPYFNTAAMDGNLWVASDTEVAGLTRTTFDGAGREVESTYQAGATDRWKTTTAYFGDRVSTTPPTGGTTTTTVINALGKPTELRQHVGALTTSGFDATTYKYTPDGKLAEVAGPDGKMWRYKYDLRGRKVLAEDPDRGTSTMTYDNAGRVKTVRDARGITLAYNHDSLGRKTAVHNESLAGTKLTQWTYDTASFGKGLLASATRFVDGKPYTASIGSYTALNKPLSTSMTIPSVEGLLGGTYTSYLGYGADGSLTGESYPEVGGLPEETVNYTLDDVGRPKSTKTAAGVVLAASTLYTRYGEVERLELGSGTKRAWHSLYYDTSNRRLIRSIVDAEVPKPMQTDLNYDYDLAGNITSITDKPVGQDPDIQCFRQDHLQRMTEAWTPAAGAGCGQAPNAGALSGPAPYWNSYTYDKAGNRLTETQRTPSSSTPRNYTYAADQPHTVDTITGPGGADSFDYDVAGNTISRVKAGVGETLSWDTEGHLSSITKNGQVTSFIYSPEGERLLRKDSSGTTLYMGKQELWLPAAGGATSATRYYTHGENVVAVRHNRSLTWLFGDHQGTAQVAIGAETLSVAKRRQLPFGATRGPAPAWPGERGFVGGTQDSSTGLTHLGAREYDPATGRFISIDPLVNMADPQQMQGYSYSSSNPANLSDPDGRCAGPDGIGCRHKVSKEGYGDMRDPANKARYEASRDTWLRNHKARNQVILRNGDVRCPDGAKTCKAVSGAPTKSEVEAQQRRERREREEKQRKLEQSFNRVIPKEARGWFGVTNLIDFESGSVCVEAKVGFLFHGHTWGCVNWDMKGITFSSGLKIGVEAGGGAHVVGMIRLNKGAMADQLDKGVFASADVGFKGGVLLTTGVNAVVEATTKGKIHGAVEVRFGMGAELSFASASVGFGANSGYIDW